VFDRQLETIRSLTRAQCELGYRDSRFKRRDANRFVVLGVEFELRREPPAPIRHGELATKIQALGFTQPTVQDIRRVVLQLRSDKGMLDASLLPGGASQALRCAGSFFVNPIVNASVAEPLINRYGATMPTFTQPDGRVKLSAGWLIERAGHRPGAVWNNVGLSPHHCLVLVAHEPASTREIVRFAHRIRNDVRERFGVELRPEPQFWGFDALDAGLPPLSEVASETLVPPAEMPSTH
jgi:UDP-N-acetylmuramate dehydrogenase